MITAKVTCQSKVSTGEGDNVATALIFHPNYADGANAEWAVWTPSLSLCMTVNGSVADKFEVGRKFTLQFVAD